MRRRINILFFVLIVLFRYSPACAELGRINQELTIRYVNAPLEVHQDLDLQERQTDEIVRGYDLLRTVKDFIRRIKDSLAILKGRRLDRMRGAELNRITSDNAKDAIRRNKLSQQTQKRFLRDRIQALKMKNKDLNQRIRDLSRR